MGTRGGGGGGSASRVGDWDVDLSDRWDWCSIPRLLSSTCLFFCSGLFELTGNNNFRFRIEGVYICGMFFFSRFTHALIFVYVNCLRVQTPSKQSRGCFGCCDKTVKKIGELSKTLITRDQLTVGEPFWSTTTIDVSQTDLNGCPAFETAPWNLDQHESESSPRLLITDSGKVMFPESGSNHRLELPDSGSSHGLPEPANPGRILWEQIREEWTEVKKLRPKVKQVREPVLSWSAAYQTVLVTNKPFPRPVPLHEVVDFFVDMWEEGGLYE